MKYSFELIEFTCRPPQFYSSCCVFLSLWDKYNSTYLRREKVREETRNCMCEREETNISKFDSIFGFLSSECVSVFEPGERLEREETRAPSRVGVDIIQSHHVKRERER